MASSSLACLRSYSAKCTLYRGCKSCLLSCRLHKGGLYILRRLPSELREILFSESILLCVRSVCMGFLLHRNHSFLSPFSAKNKSRGLILSPFLCFVIHPSFAKCFFTLWIIWSSTLIAYKFFPTKIRYIFFKFFNKRRPRSVFSSDRTRHSRFYFHKHRLFDIITQNKEK